jgi:hypothetical protein
MRLLTSENSPPISEEFLTQWLLLPPTQIKTTTIMGGKKKIQDQFQQAIDKLVSLRVFLPTNPNSTASKHKQQKSYQVHKIFQKQLKVRTIRIN